MEFLVFLFVFILTWMISNAMMQRAVDKRAKKEIGKYKKRTCPPHSWEYFDGVNEYGEEFQGLRCTTCKKRPD